MKKRIFDATRRIACAILAFLLAFGGLSTEGVKEVLADESWTSTIKTSISNDGKTCVSGEAIACVVSGREAQLAQKYDSVEFLLEIDAQSSYYGPCNLVLVKSSSQLSKGLSPNLKQMKT